MSSPPLRVFLTSEQERTLFELSKAENVPQRTRDRACALRLSSMGWKVDKIAIYLKWKKSTVRTAIHRWKNFGLMGLWDAPRNGRKRKWSKESIEIITEKLDKDQRTYNSRQILEILATLNQVHLSERQLRRILKKADAAEGEICLKYLDESGFNLWANVTYSWSKRGEQKRIEQTKKKGKRLNICGLLEMGKGFEYGLALKSFKSDSYIKLMDWQADKAEKRFSETGQITVIVEDQGPIHVSRATKAQYKKWESQGLYIFLLPTYSPELNRIENEWQRIKEDELAGRMFEDEYDLAIAVIEAIESRNERNGLEVERFLFKNEKKKKVS